MALLLVILVLGVLFVNGWTDAPNAITCVVSTGTLPYQKAVRLAAICNLLGLLLMSAVNSSVAVTITGIVRLDAAHPAQSMAVLCGAMLAIVLFAVAAWYFGIPTSESHALIAALTGAGLAQNRISAVNAGAWGKVLWGLALSLALGFGLGWLCTKLLSGLPRGNGGKTADAVQMFCAAAMSFMHGAQDGQKFVAVFVMARCLARNEAIPAALDMQGHIPALLICAGVMALGTLAGGRRIIATVGGKMVELQKYQGAGADLGGSFCLLLASLQGVPMSTTHTKTAAIMGAGAAGSKSRLEWGIVRRMCAAWAFTFPVCGMIGYLAAGMLLRLI